MDRELMSTLCTLVSQMKNLRQDEIAGIREDDACSEIGLVLMEIALREVDIRSLRNDECRSRWEKIDNLFIGI